MDAFAPRLADFEATFRPRFVERRNVRRGACDHGATVRKRGCFAVQGRIADLTTDGCRIEGVGPFPSGGEIWVRLDGLEGWLGRAVWSKSGLTGARFDRPLHPAVVARCLPSNSRVQLVGKTSQAPLSEETPPPVDELAELTNRARTMRGVAALDDGPLVTAKRPTGGTISALIRRRLPRMAVWRAE